MPGIHRFQNILPSVKAGASAFIPRYISNKLVLACLEFLRFCHRVAGRNGYGSTANNIEVIKKNHSERIRKNHGFIEDQDRYRDVSLGLTNMAYAGCEIIALYNALHDCRLHRNSKPHLRPSREHLQTSPNPSRTSSGLSRPEEILSEEMGPDEIAPEGITLAGMEDPSYNLASLIETFERDGILLSGRFGTSPRALCDYIRQTGLEADLFRLNKRQGRDLDLTSFPGDSYLLYYYNNENNIMEQIHTICITKDQKGRYIGHNVLGDKARGPYLTVRQMLKDAKQGNATGIALITIIYHHI